MTDRTHIPPPGRPHYLCRTPGFCCESRRCWIAETAVFTVVSVAMIVVGALAVLFA